ncbi:hypothetical protein RI129_011814 [Pyrocoelia pectoralis]|uniref:Uncharacterized protein n=1 Tax=Pyrocoelia pectoralis TaxID=417401 RepID=A0AAN7ZDR2_9COLE
MYRVGARCTIYNEARFDCTQLKTNLKFLTMKMFIAGLCTLLFEVIVITGVPLAYNHDYRFPRSPQRAVMLSGYYGRPSEYNPEGAMTAFVTGDTLATNSFLGKKHTNAPEQEELEIPVDENFEHDITAPALQQPNQEGHGGVVQQEVVPQNALPAKRNPKRKPVKPVEGDENDEEEEGSWPFHLGRRGPSYNAFFPIMFGGYRGIKGRDSEGGFPGSATAIANSFSTGRGGVASSHATAYGDPYVSTLLKGLNKKPTQKEE